MTRTKRMMAPALRTSTTDRLGPASRGSSRFTLALGCFLVSFPFWFFRLFFQFLPRGPSGLPSLGDEPLVSELASNHHASRPRPQPSLCNHLPTPLFMLIPRKATPPGLGIWLEMGSRKGRVGPEGTMMMGVKMWRGWARWLKTYKKMSIVPVGDSFGS